MGAMQETLMDERFAPGAHNCQWTVCFKHRKRLQNGIWEVMGENSPDMVRVQNTRCDACLTEETLHVQAAQDDRVRTANLSYVTS